VFSNGLSIVENESQIGGQIESSRQVSEKIGIKCVKWHFCHTCIYHFFCENKSVFFSMSFASFKCYFLYPIWIYIFYSRIFFIWSFATFDWSPEGRRFQEPIKTCIEISLIKNSTNCSSTCVEVPTHVKFTWNILHHSTHTHTHTHTHTQIAGPVSAALEKISCRDRIRTRAEKFDIFAIPVAFRTTISAPCFFHDFEPLSRRRGMRYNAIRIYSGINISLSLLLARSSHPP